MRKRIIGRCLMLTVLSIGGLVHILSFGVSAEDLAFQGEKANLPSVVAEMPGRDGRVAILPFENMSGRFLAIDEFMKPFYERLRERFSCPPFEVVDELILRLRLRHTGFLNTQETMEIVKNLEVDAVILGMICVYQDIPEPRIGLILKMIGKGEDAPILWMKCAEKSASMMESWFGMNRVGKAGNLLDIIARDMVEEMPADILRKGCTRYP